MYSLNVFTSSKLIDTDTYVSITRRTFYTLRFVEKKFYKQSNHNRSLLKSRNSSKTGSRKISLIQYFFAESMDESKIVRKATKKVLHHFQSLKLIYFIRFI